MPVSLVSDPAALPVRRGRGRPKKNPEPVQSSDADGLATPTRRKPGRPKKHVPEPEAAAMASATNSPVVSPTRRGRGRPRKSSVGATDTPLAPTPKRKGIESLSDADAAEPSRTRSPIAKRARTTEPESDQESARAVTPVRSRAAKPATDSFTIDIVSPARFAKARAAVPTLDRMRSANALGDSEETARWRRKFEDLSVLRITQAERNLSDLRKSANKQAATAETLIASLRKDNQELKHQIKNLQAKAKETEESEATQEVNEMDTVTRRALEKDVRDAKIESLERHQRMTETSVDFNLRDSLRILQMVSGLTIEDVVPEDQGMSYKCLQAGPTLAIGYVLTVFDDLPNEFQYTPYEETAELDVLPDFLRETMSFAQDSASLFFWRVCDHLNQIAQLQEHSPSANDTL
ncbi:hypothetical protein FBU59_001309 [Linderina macrospora]|uniref:Uncharacterized protein n=1 Tax=Linderina macrospora TaxID=4868 RepID=A0ACC1JEG0_9FUNG|nr:hypothetical protein FBU59_001309 [Linderina macrospora]